VPSPSTFAGVKQAPFPGRNDGYTTQIRGYALVGKRLAELHTGVLTASVGGQFTREAEMAIASVTKITAASPTSFDAAVQEGLARASKTLRGITGLYVLEEKASVSNGKIAEYRVTMEVTFILEG
jgi:dodecin